jgi:molecular chaperone GrpE
MAEEEKKTIEQDTEPETGQESSENTEAAEPVDVESSETPADAEDAGEPSAENTDSSEKSEKKGPFKKKKKDKKDERIEELTDQVKRQMAEFENFRKRTEKEKTQMYEIGAKSIIEKILPVVDNFERGLAAVPEEQREDPFVDGMDKIYKQMLGVLTELGVTPIEAVGKEFDPEYHNAVMQVESEEYETGIVAQELQKGYMYRDGVVRHSMVAVVQ